MTGFEALVPELELPELDIPITTTVVVAGALASRDFYPGHHDKGAAIRLGMKDVFMNILTTSGWLGRYVTDWAGPDARLTRFSVRLGTPNYPSDTMRLRGRVAALSESDRSAEVEVVAANSLGEHARATFTVVFPRVGEDA
jgi:hypothetical protein